MRNIFILLIVTLICSCADRVQLYEHTVDADCRGIFYSRIKLHSHYDSLLITQIDSWNTSSELFLLDSVVGPQSYFSSDEDDSEFPIDRVIIFKDKNFHYAITINKLDSSSCHLKLYSDENSSRSLKEIQIAWDTLKKE